MNRTGIINHLIKKFNYKSYLEIGVNNPKVNFDKVKCKKKVGVDPKPRAPYIKSMTSDEFFKKNKRKFDIIFIDGLHYASQVYKDILNALKYLNDNGVIVVHDCNPTTEDIQMLPRNGRKIWTGNVWESFVSFRADRDDLTMCVVDTDFGCGIIRRGSQKTVEVNVKVNPFEYGLFSYDFLDENRKELLNLISIDEFLRTYPL